MFIDSFCVMQLDARSALKNMEDETVGVTEVGPAMFTQPQVIIPLFGIS